MVTRSSAIISETLTIDRRPCSLSSCGVLIPPNERTTISLQQESQKRFGSLEFASAAVGNGAGDSGDNNPVASLRHVPHRDRDWFLVLWGPQPRCRSSVHCAANCGRQHPRDDVRPPDPAAQLVWRSGWSSTSKCRRWLLDGLADVACTVSKTCRPNPRPTRSRPSPSVKRPTTSCFCRIRESPCQSRCASQGSTTRTGSLRRGASFSITVLICRCSTSGGNVEKRRSGA